MAGTGGSGSGRSESEKEKTKMRERQRRAITTKIFHGLRKHGGYRLSPRSDINEVLRHLAKEAGFRVEPDGTTYRPNVLNSCPVCGDPKASATMVAAAATPSPSSSLVMCGGECSTTASPSRLPAFNSNSCSSSMNVYSSSLYGGLNHHMQEARASNHTTPDASPLHRP